MFYCLFMYYKNKLVTCQDYFGLGNCRRYLLICLESKSLPVLINLAPLARVFLLAKLRSRNSLWLLFNAFISFAQSVSLKSLFFIDEKTTDSS